MLWTKLAEKDFILRNSEILKAGRQSDKKNGVQRQWEVNRMARGQPAENVAGLNG